MSGMTQFASSLWGTAMTGMANFEANSVMYMAVVASAMSDFSRRFPTPKTRWHQFVMSPVYVLPLLAMILAFVPEQEKPSSEFVHRGAPVVPTSGATHTARYRHGEYYRVLVYFAAGDTLFNDVVPRNFFPEGVAKEKVPGMTEENPIVMPGYVTAYDLENMFKVLKVGPSGKRFEGSHDSNTWQSVLKLSAHPPFSEWGLRELAIAEMEDAFVKESVPLINRLLLGQQLEVVQWVLCAGEGLARREEPLTGDECGMLGDKMSLKLVMINLKSRIWKDELPQRDRSMYNFWDAVLNEFQGELSTNHTYTAWSDYPCATFNTD